jgi:serine/threonine protein kinase
VLRYLHLDRFADFDSEPLGSGGSGTVYGATWTLPPVSLRSMQPNGATLSVVLKQILPKFSEVEHMKKFLREVECFFPMRPSSLLTTYQLDITVTALEGSPVNCVEFLGITRASVDRAGRIAASSKTFDGEQRLFLVFQRATEGNLLTFMERRLDNLPATENSWFVVANVLGAIASGLALIHERGIVHG